MKKYGRSLKGILATAIVQQAPKYEGDAYSDPSFRQQVIAEVMRRYPSLNNSSVNSTFAGAMECVAQDSPEVLTHLPKRPSKARGAQDAAKSAKARAKPKVKRAKVRVVTVAVDGTEAEFDGELPGDFGWDGLNEHDRIRWVREVVLGKASFDPDCIYFRSPSGAAIRLGIVCQMSISDLCLAELHSVI